MKYSDKEKEQLNSFANYLSFKRTWIFDRFMNSPEKKLCFFTGNQYGKTGGTAKNYVDRILGNHPIPDKNVVYFKCSNGHEFSPYKTPEDKVCTTCGEGLVDIKRGSRMFRFASETLPGRSTDTGEDGQSAEVKNTQYPEFKKWLPKMLIKKDITFRNPSMIIHDPFGGNDIVVEFVSYNQSIQSTAGVQRLSIWFDEEPPKPFYDEQLPRLIAENGDCIITLTPANLITWTYDELFEKAKIYYKTEAICNFLEKPDHKPEQIERTESTYSIAVFQAATDDNPTLPREAIESILGEIDDPDLLAIRRYGIFKQVSGRIFKGFKYATHVIDREEYFPEGMIDGWSHARMIDYHEQNRWAIVFISISPRNECFIWKEWDPSPDDYVTSEIVERVAQMSGDYKFPLNLVDSLAAKKQSNTNKSVIDDLNRHFLDCKKEGTGTGGHWDSWDTKSTVGRDAIRERLRNAKRAERPFNNEVVEKDGRKAILPTLWILNNCKEVAKSFKQWRLEEYSDSKSSITKDAKEKPQQKFSHFPTACEAVFKDKRFRARPETDGTFGKSRKSPEYFRGARR